MEDVTEEALEENTENLAADPEAGRATTLSTALTRNPESSSPKVHQDPGEPNNGDDSSDDDLDNNSNNNRSFRSNRPTGSRPPSGPLDDNDDDDNRNNGNINS